MNTLQLRSVFVVRMISLGLLTVGLNAVASSTPVVESHTPTQKVEQRVGPSATSPAGSINEGLRSIVNEEEIPAFLRTDPCDTND
jgi:hypothetical protein